MRQNLRERSAGSHDDADIAAGGRLPPAPGSLSTVISSKSDIEFFEDLVSEPVLVLGVDISHLSRSMQFIVCASGVFFFSLLYGYLQELLSVQLCSRQLGLFLATFQFSGYTLLSFILRTFVYQTSQRTKTTVKSTNVSSGNYKGTIPVPFKLYLGLSLLRAIDLAMTNLAMQYINYPAKTLMKSSRVVFTMIFGVFITKKSYKLMDYVVVMCMVAGLAIFMHADANSSAVFQPIGVMMLTVSLLCDGAITNMSENIMSKFGVGQDEFIFRMYSIALVAIAGAAGLKGDLKDGIIFLMKPGTYAEQQSNLPDEGAWTPMGKLVVMILFSSMGFFGSSCSAAITKNFGALSMSITSTARKATTLFLSFLLFDNKCTFEHVVGIVIFISSLTAKSLRRQKKRRRSHKVSKGSRKVPDVEMGRLLPPEGSDIHTITPYDDFDRNPNHRKRRDRGTHKNGKIQSSQSASPRMRYHVV